MHPLGLTEFHLGHGWFQVAPLVEMELDPPRKAPHRIPCSAPLGLTEFHLGQRWCRRRLGRDGTRLSQENPTQDSVQCTLWD